VSNFKTPYVAPYTNWETLTWSAGDYIQFVDTGTEAVGLPNISLVQFDSNGVQKRVVSANGYVQTLGDGILYIGEPSIGGGTGYFISNSLGIDPSAESYSFATTTLDPTLTELNSYAASSTPLAPGETPISGPADEDSFTVVVSDGHGGTYTQRVTVPITPANAAPTAVTDVGEPDVDGTIAGTLAVTDTDGDTTAIVPVVAPTKGIVTLNAGGSFTYVPTAEARHAAALDGATAADLTDTFTFAVTDGHGGTTVTVVTVAIASANTAPTADTPTVGTPDGGTGAVAGTLVATDSDGDTTAVTAVTSPTRGVLTVNQATGAFTYTPDASARHAAAADGATAADLTDTFTLAVTDGHGGTTLIPVTVTVMPFNTPPTAVAQVGTPQGIDGAVAGTVIGSDIDGDTLTYSAPTTTTYGSVSIDPVTGAFIYTPDAAAPGAGAGGGGGNSGGVGGATQPVSEAGFEGGSLAGWSYGTQTGTLTGSVISGYGTGVSVISGAVTFDAPDKSWTFSPYGSYAAALQPTGGTPTFADAAAALGLTADQAQAITTTSAGTPTDAAWITRTVSLNSGTVYSMSWNYIGTDYEPYNDGSITTLVYQGSPASSSAARQASSNPIITVNNYVENYALLGFTVIGTGDYSTGSYGSTGWQTSTYQVSQSGDYLLGFAVFNLDDTALSPVLLVDSEPGTTLLNGSAFTPVAPNNPNAPSSNVASTDSFVSTVTDGHGGSATVTVTVPIT